MEPVTLGRLRIRKLFEMESGPPIPLIVSGVTPADLGCLAAWYKNETIGATAEQSAFMMSMHSYVLQVDGLTVLVDACNGNHKQRSIPDIDRVQTPYLANLAALDLKTQRHRSSAVHPSSFRSCRMEYAAGERQMGAHVCQRALPVSRVSDFEHFGNAGSWKTTTSAPFAIPYCRSTRPGVPSWLRPISSSHHRQIDDGVWLEPAFGSFARQFLCACPMRRTWSPYHRKNLLKSVYPH